MGLMHYRDKTNSLANWSVLGLLEENPGRSLPTSEIEEEELAVENDTGEKIAAAESPQKTFHRRLEQQPDEDFTEDKVEEMTPTPGHPFT